MADETTRSQSKTCVVCVEEIDDEKRLHAFGPCNHGGVCSLCYLRLRQLMKVDTCVLCKTVMDKVMVCKAENIRPYENFEMWGDSAGPEYDWDDKSRMFLPKTYNRSFVQPLQVCMKNRKVFIMEQARYTGIELQQHIVSGDAKLGQTGHPRCEFCKIRYYDAAQLHEHLVKDHYSCHLCEKQGILYKYYRDYRDLERHFRADHYLCEEEECLDKKFVVFADEIDYRAHVLQMHPNRPIGRKIQVNFKVKRSNWHGAGDEEKEEKKEDEVHEWTFEGEIGEQTQPPEVLAARREAARQAARNGGMIGLPAAAPSPQPTDEFPSLSGSTTRQATGWAALATARPRAEDFPALNGPPAGRAKPAGGGASFRNAVEAYPTRAQEIAMSGPGDGGWCFDYPMPPQEQAVAVRSAAAGRGGAAASRRVAGIGNMKLKVDKKAGKKKQKGGGGGGGAGIGGKDRSMSQHSPRGTSDADEDQRQKDNTGAPGVESKQAAPPSPPSARPAEDFPLPPGMKAPSPAQPMSSADVGPSQAQTLAKSFRHQLQVQSDTVAASAGPPSVVSELKNLLGDEAFADVKELSANYRAGSMMPGEYFKAMRSRLPQERFGELFEGLIGILPDEDKQREMLVLLAASRSVETRGAAEKKPTRSDEREQVKTGRDASSGSSTLASDPTPSGAMSTSNGGSNPAGKTNATRSKRTAAKASPPGSAATYLSAMGNKTGGKTGGTGISVVRTSNRAKGTTATVRSGLRSTDPRARSESPPPGVPLRRRAHDADSGAGIAAAGASWAAPGGSGVKGRSGVAGRNGAGISPRDFPGLSGSDASTGVADVAGVGGVYSSLARTSAAVPSSHNPRQRPPAAEDFPGLPAPAAAMPGMGRVDWGGPSRGGGTATLHSGDRPGGTINGAGVVGAGGGRKGTKKKAKQRAEKDALKGMAFGFR